MDSKYKAHAIKKATKIHCSAFQICLMISQKNCLLSLQKKHTKKGGKTAKKGKVKKKNWEKYIKTGVSYVVPNKKCKGVRCTKSIRRCMPLITFRNLLVCVCLKV